MADTHRQRFIKALRREPVEGHVPQFELVFFLTMEAFGKVHPSHRFYEQWNQMSYEEQKLQIEDMADIYIKTAQRYNRDAIFVHPNPGGLEETKWLLETIREKTGDEYYIMMHGDTTVGIPDGESMMDFTVKMFEDPDSIHLLKKAPQSLPPQAANRLKTVFCRGVYLAENTSQAPSVRLVRRSAQGVRAGDCKKPVKKPLQGFLTV